MFVNPYNLYNGIGDGYECGNLTGGGCGSDRRGGYNNERNCKYGNGSGNGNRYGGICDGAGGEYGHGYGYGDRYGFDDGSGSGKGFEDSLLQLCISKEEYVMDRLGKFGN